MGEAVGFMDEDKQLDKWVGRVGGAKGGSDLLEEIVVVLIPRKGGGRSVSWWPEPPTDRDG
jgi:hypothetical protein